MPSALSQALVKQLSSTARLVSRNIALRYILLGELIWYTEKLEETSPVEGWDGRDKNGVLLPQDTHVWRAMLSF